MIVLKKPQMFIIHGNIVCMIEPNLSINWVLIYIPRMSPEMKLCVSGERSRVW